MLIAKCSNGMFILGIDAENVRRLKAGQPILKALSQFGGTDDIAIVYGETIDDIKRTLEEAQGSPLPKPKALPVPN